MTEDEKIIIREEEPDDKQAVFRVNELAFERKDEAQLVDVLRAAGSVTLSLVAIDGDELVGHVLFSPAEIKGEDGSSMPIVGLAPIAVAPGHQKKGIGGMLIREGISKLKETGHQLCIVLGHANYYPRFGFQQADLLGIHCQWDVPSEVFMVLEIVSGSLEGVSGTAYYRPEFDNV